jgi:uncharacterized protein YegL
MEDMFERRLPVYLLIDCSESMVGDGIDAVQKGMATLIDAIHSDPNALETVWLSIITFADTATQVTPLTEASNVVLPQLRVRPGTALGAALSTLHSAIRREVKIHTSTCRGDWRPIVFLLTDGVPTDEWEKAANDCRSFYSSGPLNIIAIGCGDDINPYVLGQITDNVLQMPDISTSNFQKTFNWISSSLTTMSKQIGSNTEQRITLAKLPEGALDMPVIPNKPGNYQQKQLFLSLRCSRFGQPYLVRYRLSSRGYEPIRTHKVDNDYFTGQPGKSASFSLSSNLVLGVLPCPYCENEIAGVCECGTSFCCSPEDEVVNCPGCKSNLSFGGDRDFDISGRMG